MDQNEQNPTNNLSDDAIRDIALSFDELIVKIGEKHQPNGIQLAAIAMGRLMVFTKHVGCYDTFTEMMQAILNMREPKDLLSKTEDLKQESA